MTEFEKRSDSVDIPMIGQIEREVPGLTPDVMGTDGKIKTESNFFTLINQLVPSEVIDRTTVQEIKKVVGGVVGVVLEKLPPQLIPDLKGRKKYGWLGFGLGVLTITIVTGIEVKRGWRDLRTFMDYAPVIKKKVDNLRPNFTERKPKK